jgi:NAD(P)-dependent dehydrogenase (short-subunit alcohol dehydrogenase family)
MGDEERDRLGLVDRWSPPDLGDRVACVAGASYGVGRAVAEVLGECGATVYVTARSTRASPTKNPEWTVETTAALVDERGGHGIAASVDHTSEREVADLFGRIAGESGRLDVLANNVWQWGPPSDYTAPTWDQPVERWDAMFGVGVRSHFVTTRGALPLLLEGERGLVVSTQERPGNDDRFGQNIVVDTAAIAMQRMIRYLGRELADTTVSAALLYFGWVRTVNLGMGFDPAEVGMSQTDFEAVTQSPYMTGRAVAALAADRDVQSRSGQTLYAGEVALAYGFTDIDGRVPGYEGGALSRDSS